MQKPFIRRVLWWAVLSSFFWSCSQSVLLRVRKAPEIFLDQVDYLKVAPFHMSGKINLDIVGSYGGVGRVIRAMGNLGVEIVIAKTIQDDFIEDHRDGMEGAISRNGYYKVTKSTQYDALIHGKLKYKVEDKSDEIEELNEDSVLVSLHRIVRHVSVIMDFTIQRKDGALLGEGQITSRRQSVSKGITRNKARENLVPWEDLLESAIAATHPVFVRKIAPYEVVEKRVFEKGKDGRIKKANKLAEDGQWKSAIDIWKQFENSSNRINRAASFYNQAIYDELEGDLPGALEKYRAAKEATGNRKYTTYINRVRQRINDEALLQGHPEG